MTAAPVSKHVANFWLHCNRSANNFVTKLRCRGLLITNSGPNHLMMSDIPSAEGHGPHPVEIAHHESTKRTWLIPIVAAVVAGIVGPMVYLGTQHVAGPAKTWIEARKAKAECSSQPQAAAGSALLTILLSDLDKDHDRALTKRIWTLLNAELGRSKGKEIELLRMCEVLFPGFDNTHAQWLSAASLGRKRLAAAKADLLIWGEMTADGTFDLNWLQKSGEPNPWIDRGYTLTKERALPDDLKNVIQSTIADRVKNVTEDTGIERIMYSSSNFTNVDDKFLFLQHLYDQVLSISALPLMQREKSVCHIYFHLGRLALNLSHYTMVQSDTSMAAYAKDYFFQIGERRECTKERNFTARIDDYLGDSYMNLALRAAPGEKRGHYEDAVAQYREAVKERRAKDPNWAISQYNLGAALKFLGQCARGNEKRIQARKAFELAAEAFQQQSDDRERAARAELRDMDECLGPVAIPIPRAPPRRQTPRLVPDPLELRDPDSSSPSSGTTRLLCRFSAVKMVSLFEREGDVTCEYKAPRKRVRHYGGKIRSEGFLFASPTEGWVEWEVHKLTKRPLDGLPTYYERDELPNLSRDQRVLMSWTRDIALQPRLFSLTLNPSFVLNAVSLTLH